MVVKGSGLFKDASDPGSPTGLALFGGVGVMLIGVVLAGLAGAGRDRARQQTDLHSGRFVGALLMAVLSGVFSAGMGLAFVYGQGPIIQAMKQEGAGEIPATFAVWSVALLGGALVSVLAILCLTAAVIIMIFAKFVDTPKGRANSFLQMFTNAQSRCS